MENTCKTKLITSLAALLALASPSWASVLISDDFTGNSLSTPAGWTNLHFDPSPLATIVESGTTVTLTDPKGNSPTLMQNNTSLTTLSDFTLTLDLASTSGLAGAQPTAIAGIGLLSGTVLVFEFNGSTKLFSAMAISGNTSGQFTFPAGSPNHAPTYAGGALSLQVVADSDSFRLTSSANGFDSGDILYSSAGLAGFDSIDDLGSSPALILGADSEGDNLVLNGSLASIAFDRVTLQAGTEAVEAVPEPVSTLTLFGCAGLGLALVQRRRAAGR